MKNADKSANAIFNQHGFAYSEGLTKREYFAGLAMQGLLTSDTDCDFSECAVARMSVSQADALLKALEESNNENI